ncbi:piggyBac transposable element-derived protein 4-like [Culex quinquefasciatus]|nr:piggyBac transposable element-derived protein 4-like [Culex quinquefasciatus]XP_052565846.1 piggyBac transposable element-derived protein 4-like [Culex pipiens pallens]
MKVWCCSCVHCQYICNLQVYTGKVDKKPEKGQGKRVVLDLMQPFTGLWREVTTDNFFSSLQLSDDLFKDNTLFTGTVRTNKPDLPDSFAKSASRAPNSVLVGYNGVSTLTSFIDGHKKKPAIVLTSTLTKTTICGKKPPIVLHYNGTKGAVDAGDFITRKTNCVRKTRVWTKKLVMELLSVACLNASCLYRLKYPERCKGKSWRSNFLQQLCDQLIQENVQERVKSQRLTKELRGQLNAFSSRQMEAGAKLCNWCGKESRPIRTCCICAEAVCKQHYTEMDLKFCRECKKQGLKPKTTNTKISRVRCETCKVDRKTETKCAHCETAICGVCGKSAKVMLCEKCSKA